MYKKLTKPTKIKHLTAFRHKRRRARQERSCKVKLRFNKILASRGLRSHPCSLGDEVRGGQGRDFLSPDKNLPVKILPLLLVVVVAVRVGDRLGRAERSELFGGQGLVFRLVAGRSGNAVRDVRIRKSHGVDGVIWVHGLALFEGQPGIQVVLTCRE